MPQPTFLKRCLRILVAGAMLSLTAGGSDLAHAQDTTYLEEPTGGMHLPTVGLAGAQDATTVTLNPAGIQLLPGSHLGIALDLADEDGAVRSGPGGGIFLTGGFGGGVLPSLSWGVAVEWLRPNRAELNPDPGTPTRLTNSLAVPLGETSALGMSWHHFFDRIGTLDGVDTYDLGWTGRFGNRFAAGWVVRDLNSPSVDGRRVQRRYELELVSRPFATDRMEIGLGGRIGEDDVDFETGAAVDGWLRWSLRVIDGLYFRGQVSSDSLLQRTTSAVSTTDSFVRDHRLSLGAEISFGGFGTSVYGTGQRNPDGDLRASGGTFVARFSDVHPESIMPSSKRIEKLVLEGSISERKLTGLLAYLRKLRRDDDVVGLFVQLDSPQAGWSSMQEIRNELVALRVAGKRVFTFMVAGSTRDYFLASAADKIYVDPAGGVRLQGFAGTSLYFAGLFEKLGIKAQFERIEEYKSAPESYTRTGPTEPAFRMRNELYDSLYQNIVSSIAKSRKLSEDRVRTLIDNGPYTAGDLEKLTDLVDGIVMADDLPALIHKEMGRVYPVGEADTVRAETWTRPKVAVIYLEGDIVGGKSRVVPLLGRKLLGGETIAESIREARLDSKVEAIVLRINSPGGSALASEIMAREVKKTRGVKPIICSMGDVAASGGYFAAAYCDHIFADSMTITGSIGIFTGVFDISGLLTKLGLSWTTYKRGQNSDFGSIYKPMSEESRKLMKQKIRYFYNRFVGAVSEGRGMTAAAVDKVGRGHVWTGEQSVGIGLVDQEGGLMDAIDMAKQQAGMDVNEVATIVQLPRETQSILGQVLGSPLGKLAREQEAEIGQVAPVMQLMGMLPKPVSAALIEAIPASVWSEPGTYQARLPFAILWE